MTSVLIFLPLAGGVLTLLFSSWLGNDHRRVAAMAIGFCVATLGVAVAIVATFDAANTAPQHATDIAWIPALGIRYGVGVTGIGVWLMVLTAAMWVIAVVASIRQPVKRPVSYFFLLLLGETAVLGVFAAQDLALFVAFFDLMLVPFYFLIGMFGDGERVRVTTKFVIYTLVGSLLMLAAVVGTGIVAANETGYITFALSDLREVGIPVGSQYWIFPLVALAFLVKMPAFPIHGWMPGAYRHAPLPVAVLLAAVLSKVGAYGMLAIVLPLYPEASAHLQMIVLIVGVLSILYGSIMAFSVDETRLIVGYSSLSQLGFITVGIFALRPEGAQGAVLQMINHAVVVGALFLIIGMLARRAGSERLSDMGGIAFRAPAMATLFLIVALAGLALPGSANFIGEFMILQGLFGVEAVLATVASVAVVFAAVYMLRFYQGSMHERLRKGASSRDLTSGEALVLVPLVVAILGLSVFPQIVLRDSDRSVLSNVSPALGAAIVSEGAGTPAVRAPRAPRRTDVPASEARR